jgi:hypothetical protein
MQMSKGQHIAECIGHRGDVPRRGSARLYVAPEPGHAYRERDDDEQKDRSEQADHHVVRHDGIKIARADRLRQNAVVDEERRREHHRGQPDGKT